MSSNLTDAIREKHLRAVIDEYEYEMQQEEEVSIMDQVEDDQRLLLQEWES